jgi:hypothetical protein
MSAITQPRRLHLRYPTVLATRAPTATDDVVNTGGQGTRFQIGDTWLNTSTNEVFFLCDATANAAVWTQISGGIGAAVEIIHQTGAVTPFPASANTNAAAGTAILAAKAAAISGDLICVYRSADVTAIIAKDGVNWWFAPGVTITTIDTADNPVDLFSDADVGPKSYKVGGSGILKTGYGNVFSVNYPGSSVTAECAGIATGTAADNDGVGAAIAGGSLYIDCAGVISGTLGVWWSDGKRFTTRTVCALAGPGAAGFGMRGEPSVGK